MRKKLVVMMVATIISLTAMACGSGNSSSVEKEKVTQESQELESAVDENAVNAESGLDGEVEFTDSDEQAKVQKDAASIWYMDSEGIKNDDIGVVIRKDNYPIEPELYMGGIIFDSDGHFVSYVELECSYYEGDLDTYISEKGYTKGKIGDIDYAYKDENDGYGYITFVGNGIALSGSFSTDENINEYMNRINLIQPDDETDRDCLIYVSSEGFHSPAFGIKFSGNRDEYRMLIGKYGAKCIWFLYDNKDEYEPGSGSGGLYILSTDEYGFEYIWWPDKMASLEILNNNALFSMEKQPYLENAQSAQEVVDKYVEYFVVPDRIGDRYTEISGTADIEVGRYKYLGRGLIREEIESRHPEEWLFYSDDISWYIKIEYPEGGKYEDYISVLEKLE